VYKPGDIIKFVDARFIYGAMGVVETVNEEFNVYTVSVTHFERCRTWRELDGFYTAPISEWPQRTAAHPLFGEEVIGGRWAPYPHARATVTAGPEWLAEGV
jgi:hypothetical protein